MSNGLISNDVKSMFKDLEGNIWLGMYGEGLLRLIDDNLNFYSYVNTVGSNNIYSLSSDRNNIWFSSDNSITMISTEGALFRNSYRFPMSLTGAKPNTIFCSEGGLIYLGFEKKGVFTFDPGSEEFKKIFISQDDLENSVNHITGKGNIDQDEIENYYGHGTLKHERHEHSHNGDNEHQSANKYKCPKNCEGNKVYDNPDNCPVCNMKLMLMNDKHHDTKENDAPHNEEQSVKNLGSATSQLI